MFFYIYRLIERSSLRNLLSGIGEFLSSITFLSQSSILFESKNCSFLTTISYDYTLNLDIFVKLLIIVVNI